MGGCHTLTRRSCLFDDGITFWGRHNYGCNGYVDDQTVLLPEDDAATANWGTAWRMPTIEEWEELMDNTTNALTTRNGVNGMLFTLANGNSLFFPAAGYRDDEEDVAHNDHLDGWYWSRARSRCRSSARPMRVSIMVASLATLGCLSERCA